MPRPPASRRPPAKAPTLAARIADADRAGHAAEANALRGDRALLLGDDGPEALPAVLLPDYQAVRTAFAKYEAGDDDGCRAALGQLGLQSPFAEWKLLLRGLLAYAHRDDGRALDNWSRLTPGRAPALAVAPLRAGLDPAFAQTLPERQRKVFRTLAAEFTEPAWATRLRTVCGRIDARDGLYDALGRLPRLAKDGLPAEIVPRLRALLAQRIVAGGTAADLRDLDRALGPPPADPGFRRGYALIADKEDGFVKLHAAWQAAVAELPAAFPDWPAAKLDRARALIFDRVADLGLQDLDEKAAENPTEKRLAKQAALLAAVREACDESLRLAPDRAAGWALKAAVERRHGTAATRRAHAEQTLTQFPDHDGALSDLAMAAREQGDWPAALAAFEHARRVNPLDGHLPVLLENARRGAAQHLAVTDKPAAATLYAAVAADPQATGYAVADAALFAQWTGDASAEARQALAVSRTAQPAGVAVSQLALAHAWKLKPAARKPLETALAAALAAPPNGDTAFALAQGLADGEAQMRDYRGRKTHVTRIRQAVEKAAPLPLTDKQRQKLCEICIAFDWAAAGRTLAVHGAQQHPRQAFYPLYEAQLLLTDGRKVPRVWQVKPLLDKARTLIDQTADPAEQARLRAMLKALDEQFRELSPFAMFENIFGGFGGPNEEAWP